MTREDEGRGDPGNPSKDGEEGGCPDSFGLPVVLGRGPEQGGEAEAGEKEKEDVGEGEEVRLRLSRLSEDSQQLAFNTKSSLASASSRDALRSFNFSKLSSSS